MTTDPIALHLIYLVMTPSELARRIKQRQLCVTGKTITCDF